MRRYGQRWNGGGRRPQRYCNTCNASRKHRQADWSFHNQYYPCRRRSGNGSWSKVQKSKNGFPKTGVRLSVRHVRHRRVYCRITCRYHRQIPVKRAKVPSCTFQGTCSIPLAMVKLDQARIYLDHLKSTSSYILASIPTHKNDMKLNSFTLTSKMAFVSIRTHRFPLDNLSD